MLLPVPVTVSLAIAQFAVLLTLPEIYTFTVNDSWASLLAFYLFSSVTSIITNVLRQKDMDQINSQIVRISESEARLYEQAIHDPLSGLYNRRYMEETLGRETHRAMRNQSSMGIILIDLDYFKDINDTYGHSAGDLLLQELGACLKTSIRKSDIACRFGGDEFVLILPDSPLEDTLQRAEDIRQLVMRITLEQNGTLIRGLTASLGVSIYPQHGSSGDELLKNADDALYSAKSSGRNQVVLAEGQGAVIGA
jgi:diguanylate cyclase (GGDEF)-like protein